MDICYQNDCIKLRHFAARFKGNLSDFSGMSVNIAARLNVFLTAN
jgi:hypothetical protein